MPLLFFSYAIAYVDRVNVSLATIEMSKDLGCDLRLMSSVNDVSGIPTAGKNLIIVAAVDKVLHFRIFDDDGKAVVDTDEKRLTEQGPANRRSQEATRELVASPRAYREREGPGHHRCHINRRSHPGLASLQQRRRWLRRPGRC